MKAVAWAKRCSVVTYCNMNVCMSEAICAIVSLWQKKKKATKKRLLWLVITQANVLTMSAVFAVMCTQFGLKFGDDIDSLLYTTVRVFVCASINKWRLETWEACWVYSRSQMLIFWKSRNQQVDFFPQGSWCPAGSHKPRLFHNQICAAGQRNEEV